MNETFASKKEIVVDQKTSTTISFNRKKQNITYFVALNALAHLHGKTTLLVVQIRNG